MIDKSELEKGWRYAADHEGGQTAAYVGYDYINRIAASISELQNSINAYEGSKQGVAQLGGFVAEDWAAKTFNINAIAAESAHRAIVEKSTDQASVDVSTNFGENYSLKYLKDAERSVKAQAKNVIQNYHEYLSKAKANGTQNPMSFDEYLARYNYSDDLEDLLLSVYRDQKRIIPADQLEEGIRKLRLLIAKEFARGGEHRLLNLKNYEDTLNALCDRIKDNEGIESIPLTKAEAEAIAELCKTGDFDPADFGITLNSQIMRQYILNQSLKGGITATIVSFAIQLIPELINLLSVLVKDQKIDIEKIKTDGLKIISTAGKSFVIGYVSCGVYTACAAGKFGANFTDLQPGIIGTVAALTFKVMVETFDYSRGNIDNQEFNYRITKDIIISVSSLAGGTIATSILPLANALSFMTGSMAGSVIASVALTASEKICISFCVETGYTLFGLVKQDYSLPKEILNGMGLSLAEISRSFPNRSTSSTVSLGRAIPTIAKPNHVDIMILKRGIIAFHRVGYVF